MKWLNHLTPAALALALASAPGLAAAQSAATQNTQAQQATTNQDQSQQNAGQQNAGQQNAGQQNAGQQNAGQQNAGQNAEQAAQGQSDNAKAQRKLQIFELEHRDPQQLTQMINLWDQATVQSGTAARNYGRAQRAGQQQGDEKQQRVAIAVDNEKKLLFVRGTDQQIEKIRGLVEAVDKEDKNLEAHDFADYRLIPIPGPDSSRIQSMLSQLELDGRMIRLGQANFVAYRVEEDGAETRKQAEQVINRLTGADQQENQDSDQNQDQNQDQSSNQDGNQNAGQQQEQNSDNSNSN